MFRATLGGIIKDFRIKKRLSQLDVSLHIGWKDTSRLSKIEQGRSGKPTRDTIEKIMQALDLSDQEKGELLFIGGYLPTDDEVKKIVRETRSKVENWPYPSYMIDFSFRQILTNTINILAFNLPIEWVKMGNKMWPSVLEYPFFSKQDFPVDVEKGEDEHSLKPFQIAQIASFKTENFMFKNEKWYKTIIGNLMKYKDFRKLWPTVDHTVYKKQLLEYEFKKITGIYEGKKKSLLFHMLSSRVINDPRFQVVLYFPANEYTRIYCEKLKQKS